MPPLWKQILDINPLSSAGSAVAPLWKRILQPTQQPIQSTQRTTDTLLPSTQSIAPLWQRILNQDIYKQGSPPAQARQSARLLGEQVRQKVGQPFARGAMQAFQKTGEKTMEIMNPGTSAEGKGVSHLSGDDLMSYAEQHATENFWGSKETFDLTGKSNPQYRRYSDWGKFLKNKYGGKEVIDAQGNRWMEIDLKPEHKKMPIEAFGILPFTFLPLTDKKDKNGK